jgi:hypothetical protein
MTTTVTQSTPASRLASVLAKREELGGTIDSVNADIVEAVIEDLKSKGIIAGTKVKPDIDSKKILFFTGEVKVIGLVKNTLRFHCVKPNKAGEASNTASCISKEMTAASLPFLIKVD